MKNIKLNEIIFALAGICLFVGLANLLAVAEGVNAPQDAGAWLLTALWLGIAGTVVRLIGMLARSR